MSSRRFMFRRLTNWPPRIVFEHEQRVVVGRQPRDRHLADAQLGLRRARPVDERRAARTAAAGAGIAAAAAGSGPAEPAPGVASAHPPNARSTPASSSSCERVSHRDDRRPATAATRRRGTHATSAADAPSSPPHRADRQPAVGMAAVEQRARAPGRPPPAPGRAAGEAGSGGAREPGRSRRAASRGRATMSASRPSAWSGKARQRQQREHRRVRSHLRLELRADARQRVLDVERRLDRRCPRPACPPSAPPAPAAIGRIGRGTRTTAAAGTTPPARRDARRCAPAGRCEQRPPPHLGKAEGRDRGPGSGRRERSMTVTSTPLSWNREGRGRGGRAGRR